MVEWRPVCGYENRYLVSDQGAIRHLLSATPRKVQVDSRCGRAKVQVRSGGCGTSHVTLWLHRVVAEAFLGPRPLGHEINHKDGNRLNNAATNLEWCTHAENIAHSWRTGLRRTRTWKKGRVTPRIVEVLQWAKSRGLPISKFARSVGLSESGARLVANGKIGPAHGA